MFDSAICIIISNHYYYLIMCRFMSSCTAKLFVYYFGFGTSNEPKYLETRFSVFCVKYYVSQYRSAFEKSIRWIKQLFIHYLNLNNSLWAQQNVFSTVRRCGCLDFFRHIHMYNLTWSLGGKFIGLWKVKHDKKTNFIKSIEKKKHWQIWIKYTNEWTMNNCINFFIMMLYLFDGTEHWTLNI